MSDSTSASECGGHCYSLTESGGGYVDPDCPKHSPTQRPPGMATGTCGDRRHASQHPPHIVRDEHLGEFWCVGGWVRDDGTIPWLADRD